MKEVTYGWYPSAQDIYRPKGRPASYHLECLYKHQGSLYYQGPAAPPEPELFVRGVKSPAPSTPSRSGRKAKSVPVPKFSPVPVLHIPTPTQCWNSSTRKGISETSWGLVGESSPKPQTPSQGVHWPLARQKTNRPTLSANSQQLILNKVNQVESPQCAWGFKRAPSAHVQVTRESSSGLKWPNAQKPVPVKTPSSPNAEDSANQKETTDCGHKSETAPVVMRIPSPTHDKIKAGPVPTPPRWNQTPNSKSSQRPSRIQSATTRREKTPLPARPLTAASPRKELSVTRDFEATRSTPSGSRSSQRPAAPVPFVYDVNDNVMEESLNIVTPEPALALDGDRIEDYEQIVKKYGWRAEVHGDPFKVKKIPKRMSYAVACEEPDVPPEPPGVHMETNEPFFLNTIPRKPATFSVDKEWMSEVLMAKRLELQKRDGGVRYCYKNFSFVY